jgi:hypothetical protein
MFKILEKSFQKKELQLHTFGDFFDYLDNAVLDLNFQVRHMENLLEDSFDG